MIETSILRSIEERVNFKPGDLVKCNGAKESHKFVLAADVDDPIVIIPTETVGIYLGLESETLERATVLFGEHVVLVLNIFLEKA
jgi:hypothetical protein